MKKSFFIFLFSVIGLSFLSAQERVNEPVQKQTKTSISQEKLQRASVSPNTSKPISKSEVIKANEKNTAIKSGSVNTEKIKNNEVKETEAIEPTNSGVNE